MAEQYGAGKVGCQVTSLWLLPPSNDSMTNKKSNPGHMITLDQSETSIQAMTHCQILALGHTRSYCSSVPSIPGKKGPKTEQISALITRVNNKSVFFNITFFLVLVLGKHKLKIRNFLGILKSYYSHLLCQYSISNIFNSIKTVQIPKLNILNEKKCLL